MRDFVRERDQEYFGLWKSFQRAMDELSALDWNNSDEALYLYEPRHKVAAYSILLQFEAVPHETYALIVGFGSPDISPPRRHPSD